MGAQEHKAYNEENQKLGEMIEIVKEEKDNFERKIQVLSKNIKVSSKGYVAGNIQSFMDLLVEIPNYQRLRDKYNALTIALKKPYFAKIDFRDSRESQSKDYYIGKSGVMKDEDASVVIVDWRAPISSLYYDGRLGNVHYMAPEGKIEGDLLLKRQFIIDNSELQEIYDIDITTRDEMLQKALGNSVNNRLKDIVETIQQEQNEIIRHERNRTIIVQGVAGSGKTTIALHRVAYLLYDADESVIPERFMIIAPNRLFLSYISNVLPELGVENIKQTTYEEFAFEIIGERYNFIDIHERFNQIANSNDSASLKRALEIKGSLKFRDALKAYMDSVINNYFKKEDFILGKSVILSSQQIEELFLHDYSYLPPSLRKNEVEKNLNNNLQAKIEKFTEKVEIRFEETYKALKQREAPQQTIVKLIEMKDEKLKTLKDDAQKLRKHFKTIWDKRSVMDYYKEFITNLDKYAGDYFDSSMISFISDYTLKNIKKKVIEQADLAPLVYITKSIFGIKNKDNIDNVLVDEAQDMSLFELYTLREFANNSNSFMLVGDISQGIHSYKGVKNWHDVAEEVFDRAKTDFANLTTSYRTTIEVMNFANKVLENLKDESIVYAKPVIRSGLKPIIAGCESIAALYRNVSDSVKILQEKGYNSIALICKTFDEVNELYEYMSTDTKVSMLTTNVTAYEGGVIIAPAALTKGLEFDAVIMVNVSDKHYKVDPIDIKLLYICCTRALHVLAGFYVGNVSPLIESIDTSAYTTTLE